jgi:hypothetical protein
MEQSAPQVATRRAGKRKWPGKLTAFVLLLLLLGALVAYFGTQSEPLSFNVSSPSGVRPVTSLTAIAQVSEVNLEFEEYVPPLGPHRDRFQVNCTICHSVRLVFTQPLLSEKKWQEVVRKMITVYGASLPSEEERQIIEYLVTVHGSSPN